MENFLKNLAISASRLYNIMHGIPETADNIANPDSLPTTAFPPGTDGWSAVYARKE